MRKIIYIIFLSIVLSCVFGVTLMANSVDLQMWKKSLRNEAVRVGIKEATVERALRNFIPIKRVIELDRRQPEFTLSFSQYIRRVVPKRRILKGRAMLRDNREILTEISKKYDVQPRFIVALWGIETDFGRIDGGFSVIHALATLAFDGRRGKFFRGQLIKALRILDQGHISLDKMKGSWAGAMGHFQFMPSSFENFAVDYDQDGRRDIWKNKKDAFASAANYLAKSGWRGDQTWGREVKVPKQFNRQLISNKIKRPMREWRRLGVRKSDGTALPMRNLLGSLVRAKGANTPIYLVYNNYFTILKWNRSIYFAVAVGILAEKIATR